MHFDPSQMVKLCSEDEVYVRGLWKNEGSSDGTNEMWTGKIWRMTDVPLAGADESPLFVMVIARYIRNGFYPVMFDSKREKLRIFWELRHTLIGDFQ